MEWGLQPATLGRRLLLVLLPVMTGCAGTEWFRCPDWKCGPPCGEVSQVMALWTDGVSVLPDQACDGVPTPHIGGRVYLFGPEPDCQLLRCDGQLLVCLYAEAPPGAGVSPNPEVWVITSEALQPHLKKDGVGWGYNLWLPWRTFQPGVRRVTMTVQYRPPIGREIWSQAMPLSVAGPGGLRAPTQFTPVTTTSH